MKAGTRLALYGVGLAAASGGGFLVADAVVPDSFVTQWAEGREMNTHGEGHDGGGAQLAGNTINGVALEAGGFTLSPVLAPASVGTEGELSFQIETSSGEPVTAFTEEHDKELHLIVVRTDGSGFRHVHPELDTATGTWSLPWKWDEAGTYRVYADFTPGANGAGGVTLTRSLEVAGNFAPMTSEVQRITEVDGFKVTLGGDLTAGKSSDLSIAIERDGTPVKTLEPYLGAFGHLVALREGDLAYLHVHAEGDAASPGDTAGPDIGFAAEAPTAGRYLLYFDFQVEGKVRTAKFVIEANRSDSTKPHADGEGGH